MVKFQNVMTSRTRHLKQSNKIERIWTGLENFVMHFCILFDGELARFYFWKGERALCYVFTLVGDFPNFLRSKVLSCSATLDATRIQFFFCTRYQVPFYLRRIKPVGKCCKVPNWYDQDCLAFCHTS